MSRAWSPPLDVNTRTINTFSIVRARPEHLDALYDIQIRAYPGMTKFHESPEVFRSKLNIYPAGNFVAMVTSSVVTNDDTSTWDSHQVEKEVDEQEQGQEAAKGDAQGAQEGLDEGAQQEDEEIHGITVVEITETAPDGSNITTTTTSTTTDSDTTLEEGMRIIRARTPDIVEKEDNEDEEMRDSSLFSSSSGLLHPRAATTTADANRKGSEDGNTKTSKGSNNLEAHGHAHAHTHDDDDLNMTTVLFQWEQPVGYLLSHPFSRESVTLHRVGGWTDKPNQAETTTSKSAAPASEEEMLSRPKKIRLDEDHDTDNIQEITDTDSDEESFEHDPWMEKYYIHDCAIHPDWRGHGLARRLWKALEESLTPSRDQDQDQDDKDLDTVDEKQNQRQDFMETEEQQQPHHRSREQGHNEQTDPHSRRHHRHKGRRGRSHRKGAPNLKEIALVSVCGSKPFWEHTGGFRVVPDHDFDLGCYGDEAFLMSKPFSF